MSRINRLPWGLQNLLGSTAQGDNPSNLEESVRPILDVTPHYELERLNSQSVSGANTAIGGSETITIPDGEVWEIVTISCSALNSFNAGGFIRMALKSRAINLDTDTNNNVVLAVGPQYDVVHDVASTAVSFQFAWQPPYKQFWRGGTRFQVIIIDAVFTGASVTMGMQILYRRWSI